MSRIIRVFAMTFSLAIAYAALYLVVAGEHPGSFRFGSAFGPFDAIYFGVTTAATVGYGDIAPVSHLARILVTTQILTTATALARFVSEILGTTSSGSDQMSAPPSPEVDANNPEGSSTAG